MNSLLKAIQDVSESFNQSRMKLAVPIQKKAPREYKHLCNAIHLVSDTYEKRVVEVPRQKEIPKFEHLISSIRSISQQASIIRSPITFRDAEGESLLNFLNKEENENFHSDFIGGFLDSRKSGKLAGELFSELVYFAKGEKIKAPFEVSSRRELSLGELVPGIREEIASRRIDILAQTAEYLLVIENKVNSYESTAQTADYHEVSMQFNSNLVRPKKLVEILLSPRGDTPDCNAYVPMTYHALFQILVQLRTSIADRGESRFLDLYLESLFENYFKSDQKYKDYVIDFWRKYER
jgi:hypothetical protein